MTIGAIIVCVIFTVTIAALGIYIGYNCHDSGETEYGILALVIALIIIGGIWGGTYWYYSNTESGKRALKTQDSNLNNGIEREVIVYDMDGDELEYFRGRFDVDYEDERIMFDDENGNRHVIYFKSGTVIINEIEGEEK